MNCPSCGTDEFYEGFLSRECKNPTCKLYTEKHAEACRKPPELTPRLDQVKPLGVCSTCNDTGTINMTGARVSCPDCQSPPNRLGGLFQWMPSKNTVQPKGTGGGIAYTSTPNPRHRYSLAGLGTSGIVQITEDVGTGGLSWEVYPNTVTQYDIACADLARGQHGDPATDSLADLLEKWLVSRSTTTPTTTSNKPPAFPGPIDIANMVDAGILSKSQGVDLIKKLYPDTDQVVFGPGSVSRTVFGPSKP